MGLGREMGHGIGFGHQTVDQICVGQVALDQCNGIPQVVQ